MQITGECPKCGAPFYAVAFPIEGRIEEPQAHEPKAEDKIVVIGGHDYAAPEDWNSPTIDPEFIRICNLSRYGRPS